MRRAGTVCVHDLRNTTAPAARGAGEACVSHLCRWPDRARCPLGHARDRRPFANSPLKAWFDSLRSGKGPCCSDADGSAVSDTDWESKERPLPRAVLDGEWSDVPEEAVISEPNRVGRTMVWPIYGYMGVAIRCFMPGSMT